MPMLKRSPSLTEQVKSHLKQRIVASEFEAGRIPSESDLASELNVSRNTIRDALSRLEMEGFVVRRQGAGTFVNQHGLLIKTRLDEIVPYENLIHEHGYEPAIKLLCVEEQPADPGLAATLNLEASEPVLVIHKLFLADASPVIFNQTHLPLKWLKRPHTPDDFLAPVYQILPKLCQQELAYAFSEIVPLIAPPWLMDRLALPSTPTALLALEEIGYNPDNDPILKACSYFRDDLLRLRLIRRQSQ
ncbi:MAG: GntR family transcriptional regulator [Anaerolineae bacterium]|nr:GntR family transcriptional regulator [Anaerolineae bacterium]